MQHTPDTEGSRLPAVSVVINTFNDRPEHLQAAVDGYLGQVGVAVEVIVSTVEGDQNLSWAMPHYEGDSRVRWSIMERSQHPGRGYEGIYAQLNRATEHVSHEWFAYASGNDVPAPDKIRGEIDLALGTGKQVVYSDFWITDADLNPSRRMRFPAYRADLHLRQNFVSDCALISSQLLRRYLPFRLEHQNHAFWDLWLRIYEGDGEVFAHRPIPGWYYRTLPGSQRLLRRRDRARRRANRRAAKALRREHELRRRG